jgi:hypothetical protein
MKGLVLFGNTFEQNHSEAYRRVDPRFKRIRFESYRLWWQQLKRREERKTKAQRNATAVSALPLCYHVDTVDSIGRNWA